MTGRLLLVDDDELVLASLSRTIGRHFRTDTALGGPEGLKALASGITYSVIVSDYQMPEMDGIEFLQQAQEASPDTVRVMLTGQADLGVAMEAVNSGSVFRFLTKPCPPDQLLRMVEAAVRQYELVTAERELLSKTFGGSIKVLVDVLALASPVAFGRASRVFRLVQRFALPLFHPEETWEVCTAAMLSQLGCITLPRDILQRAYRGEHADQMEHELFLSHPAVARDLIGAIPRLERIAEWIAYQEKRFDGTGPPYDTVSGEAIPLAARVLHAAVGYDTYDLLGVAPEMAIARMRGQAARYDPNVVAPLAAGVEAAERLGERYVALADLGPRMVLADDVEASNGVLLVTKGQEVTPAIRACLRNYLTRGLVEEPFRVLVPVGGGD